MFETYRMLGEQHEADLIREAEKHLRAAAVPRRSRSGRRRYGLYALVTALAQVGSQRPAEHVLRDNRRPT